MLSSENTILIMVVSSDLLTMEYLQTVLDSRKFEVNNVIPTKEGISKAHKVNPDIFVVDDLGSGDGILNTCQLIRQYSLMPIMVLSSQRKSGLVEQTLDAGADEFLIKPVPGSVMAAHLNTLARRALAEKEAALSILSSDKKKGSHLGLLTY